MLEDIVEHDDLWRHIAFHQVPHARHPLFAYRHSELGEFLPNHSWLVAQAGRTVAAIVEYKTGSLAVIATTEKRCLELAGEQT